MRPALIIKPSQWNHHKTRPHGPLFLCRMNLFSCELGMVRFNQVNDLFRQGSAWLHMDRARGVYHTLHSIYTSLYTQPYRRGSKITTLSSTRRYQSSPDKTRHNLQDPKNSTAGLCRKLLRFMYWRRGQSLKVTWGMPLWGGDYSGRFPAELFVGDAWQQHWPRDRCGRGSRRRVLCPATRGCGCYLPAPEPHKQCLASAASPTPSSYLHWY